MVAVFKEHEVVKVQGRDFPVIGGRLRIAHEIFKDRLSIETELVDYEVDRFAVVRARVETSSGVFSATGTATSARDPKLADSLLELAETRACARALRLSGVGAETCGYEELRAGEVLGERPREKEPTPGLDKREPSGRPRPALATGAQKRAIVSLVRRLGREMDHVLQEFGPGSDLESLSLTAASSLIDKLKARAGNGHRAGHEVRVAR